MSFGNKRGLEEENNFCNLEKKFPFIYLFIYFSSLNFITKNLFILLFIGKSNLKKNKFFIKSN
jgi:hypothetical protein